MKTRALLVPALLLILVLLLLPACGGDDNPTDPGGGETTDTLAPAAVTDLQVTAQSDNSLTLGWTAPGDDGHTGTATAYDVRHAAVAITAGNWDTATPVTGPAPLAAGSTQSLVITNPDAKSTLHVALKAVDEAGNWSGLSNDVNGDFPDPPATVHTLTSSGVNTEPWLHDGVLTWIRSEAGGQNIYMAHLNAPIPVPIAITDNGGFKDNVRNHGAARIVWQGRPDEYEDWEIWLYDPVGTPSYAAFTDNDTWDTDPVLTNAEDFAWLHGSAMFQTIHFWDAAGQAETVISDAVAPTSEFNNERPVAEGGMVGWRVYHRAAGSGRSFFLWDGDTTQDISESIASNLMQEYTLQGGDLVYGYHGDPDELRLWDGSEVQFVGAGDDPSLHDGRVAYTKWDGYDYEIFYWDGTETRQITDNEDIVDHAPTLWGDWLVWCSRADIGGTDQIMYMRVE